MSKTTRLVALAEKCLDTVCRDPLRLGFVTFTRAARREASKKAADRFGLKPSDLERAGYYRTLHSIAYRQLGCADGDLLLGDREDNEWLKRVLDDEKASLGRKDADDDLMVFSNDVGDTGKALMLWDVARQRQIALEGPWHRSGSTDERLPDLGACQRIVGLYEDAKRKDGRLDFTDLLMRFAGRRWSGDHDHPFTEVEPDGRVPLLPVWIFDEAQDASLLSALVFCRLISLSQYVYLAGDHWQAIYEWAGADPNIFAHWQVAKEECLPTSYRCPSRILAFADGIMLRGGHAQRPFASERQGGEIRRVCLDEALDGLRPGDDVLVLARTNEYARQAAQHLDENMIPWKPTKGGGGWTAPARAAGIVALETLRTGGEIDGRAIHRLLELLPSRAGGTTLVERGSKKYFDDEDNQAAMPAIDLAHCDILTEPCREAIASGRYVELLDPAAGRMAASAQKHGVDAISRPTITVGTCHSAKGMQASHVVAINQISYPTQCACQTAEGLDEERRLWFVTCSRASERLTIAETRGEPFPDL